MQRWDLLSMDAPEGMRDPIVLHSGADGRAVLIVLRPGQELGEHQVTENAWIAVLDGSVKMRTGGDDSELRAGALVRFDAGERRALASADGARLLMVLAPWPGEGHYRGDDR